MHWESETVLMLLRGSAAGKIRAMHITTSGGPMVNLVSGCRSIIQLPHSSLIHIFEHRPNMYFPRRYRRVCSHVSDLSTISARRGCPQTELDILQA